MVSAQGLYRSLGFEAIPAYYNTPVPDTLFMRKTLVPP
jgi:ribosomal protein S18 acetylase RimI-like enzyme